MSNGSFATWKDKLLFWSITTFVAGGISWAAWMTISTSSKPSVNEVRRIVKAEAPYVQERQMILAQLTSIGNTENKLADVITRNTEAINALRVEIAKLEADNNR